MTTTQKQTFELSRATEGDLPELVELLHRCFPERLCRLFLGGGSTAFYPQVIEMLKRGIREDNSVWIKVIDTTTGKIIAGSEWRVYVSHPSLLQTPWQYDWLDDESKEQSMRMHQGLNEAKAKAISGPFVYLRMCFTDETYRRRGAGGMMLQWGVDVADVLSVPAWIEATEDGNALYRNYGFYAYEKVNHEGFELLNMKRDARVKRVVGGK